MVEETSIDSLGMSEWTSYAGHGPKPPDGGESRRPGLGLELLVRVKATARPAVRQLVKDTQDSRSEAYHSFPCATMSHTEYIREAATQKGEQYEIVLGLEKPIQETMRARV